MANIKISQLPAKGANLGAQDLVEVAEFTGTGYVSKSITGQEIIDAATPAATTWGSITGTLSTQTDLQTALDAKQDDLVSGTNIKTINSNSLLGSGNISVQDTLVSGSNIKTINGSSVLGSGNLTISGGGGIHVLTQPYTGMAVGLALNTANHNGTTSFSANTLSFFPFIPASTFTIDQILLPVVTNAASGQASIAIYSDLNSRPNSRLYLSSIIDCSTTGNKILTTSFTFTAGTKYWFSLTQNNATITFRGMSFNWTYQFAWLNNSGSTNGANCFAYLITTPPGTEPTTVSTGSLSLNFANIPNYSLRSI